MQRLDEPTTLSVEGIVDGDKWINKEASRNTDSLIHRQPFVSLVAAHPAQPNTCLSFQLRWSYQDGYRLATVKTHDNIYNAVPLGD